MRPKFTQTGNVIAADFRPQPMVAFNIDTLYCDENVCLVRATFYYAGEEIGAMHMMQEL